MPSYFDFRSCLDFVFKLLWRGLLVKEYGTLYEAWFSVVNFDFGLKLIEILTVSLFIVVLYSLFGLFFYGFSKDKKFFFNEPWDIFFFWQSKL